MVSGTSCLSSDHREGSSETGGPPVKTRYNKNGRPIRRSAGKVKPSAGFVDSKVIEDECEDPIAIPSEDEDGEIKPQRKRKRKRTPSPEPPQLEDLIRDEQLDQPSDGEEDVIQKTKSTVPPITLQFNVPLGFHGPMMVKLDRNMLEQDMVADMQAGRTAKRLKAADSEAGPRRSNRKKKSVGFLDLAPELRNTIYRHVFVTDKVLNFPKAEHLNRSSQFLRTCKLVHSEGCSVLYGENKFCFDRNVGTRGPFWEPIPKEIGYKDIRQFLKMIGPENLVYLRDIMLILEDARPAATPGLDHEQRRFIKDEHLLDVLRVLRQTKLRKFSVVFNGRRSLGRSDSKFISYLVQIRADEITNSRNSGSSWYHYNGKVDSYLWKEMQDTMTRKKKLYLPEK